jgi:hypothetical protein
MTPDTYTDTTYVKDDPKRPSLYRVQVFNPPENMQGQPGITTSVYLEFPALYRKDAVVDRITAQAQAVANLLSTSGLGKVTGPTESSDREGRKLLVI